MREAPHSSRAMNLTDLLSDPVLHLVLHTSTTAPLLARPISWCAPTELLDPSPYLTTNALVLTTGMGLNFRDPRTWDAYVERLAAVPVSGIVLSTGDAHRAVPPGLVEAAGAHDVPVLELMADVHTLLLMRHVESALSTERFRAAQRTWDLADSCARLVIQGADITALLDHLENAASGPVALTDPAGTALFSSRGWLAGADKTTTTTRRLPLPDELAGQCSLVVPETVGREIAGPAAAVIAMQVVQSLGKTGSPGAAQPFVEALLAPGTSSRDLADAMTAAALDPGQPTFALCLDLTGETTGSVSNTRWARHFQLWRIRSLFEAKGLVVRQAKSGESWILVVQGTALQDTHCRDELVKRLTQLVKEHHFRGAMTPVAAGPRSLCASLPVAMTNMCAEGVITRPDEQTLLDLVARSAPISVREFASDILGPLRTNDPSEALIVTLKVVVAAGGQRERAAASLGIHRNTLASRVHRIQELTGWNLSDGNTMAALAVALRLAQR